MSTKRGRPKGLHFDYSSPVRLARRQNVDIDALALKWRVNRSEAIRRVIDYGLAEMARIGVITATKTGSAEIVPQTEQRQE